MPFAVADELVVVKLRGKPLFSLEHFEHILNHPHDTALLLHPFVVLFEFDRELGLQRELVRIEGDDCVGYHVVRPARTTYPNIIRSGEGLNIESIRVGGVEEKTAASVEYGDEHAQGVIRESADALVRFKERPLFLGRNFMDTAPIVCAAIDPP